MDNFAPSSEDFLSSGFQQLYSELNEDEIFLWDSDLLINNNSDICNNNNNNNYYFNPEPIYYNEEEEQFLLNNNFCDNSVNLNEPNTYNNYEYEQQDWDLNLESLVLENSIECTSSEYSLGLPEKTLFCNDSCDLFLKESSENLNLKLNQQKEDEKHFPCSFGSCMKIYAKAAHLKAHLRRHLGDKPYVCTWPECTWKFSRSDELARHRRSHSGVKPFKCIYCTKCFARSDHLAKHRKVHERKIASGKINGKGLWGSLQPVRSGRRPKCEL